MSSLKPVATEDFEKLHRAYLADEDFTPELKMIHESLLEKLRISANKTKDYSWSPEDIEDIVSGTIERTIKDGKISVSFIGAALSNLRTVKNEYTTCFKERQRKQVKGDRDYLYSDNDTIGHDEEKLQYYLQRFIGEHYTTRPDQLILIQEAAGVVRQALHSCDIRTQTILWNVFFNKMRNKAIGKQLGLKEDHVSKLKKRGLKKMKESLEGYFRD
ncbi:sigma-70 family RNA polymerase sigma factor [Paenibacillus marchantiae]|uniref:sigma-70 family RNA polymerase sigma factor n=1 Tax=Paenibacillus marchantiae TaxID=3026433 RepID=UPI00237B6F43|nr:sigma-70 family RNA polymerase sigma factor [Paenibacillus marchantiae]WDQ32160.1 sigma-70 family RNA polymerase sigma factor [Paenibacillus marchantiae]